MTQKARVTTIDYAGLEFEGLMLPDGSYAIALSQISVVFLGSRKISTTQLNRLTGVDFKSHQCSTELGRNKSVIIDLDTFTLLTQALAQKGNEKAISFAIASMVEKLERVFANAFNQKFDEERAEVKFKARMEHAKQFHPFLTIWFKKDGCQGKEYAIRVNQFKKAIALPLINIESYNSDQLTKLNQSEIAYNTLRGIGYSHLQTLEHITIK